MTDGYKLCSKNENLLSKIPGNQQEFTHYFFAYIIFTILFIKTNLFKKAKRYLCIHKISLSKYKLFKHLTSFREY